MAGSKPLPPTRIGCPSTIPVVGVAGAARRRWRLRSGSRGARSGAPWSPPPPEPATAAPAAFPLLLVGSRAERSDEAERNANPRFSPRSGRRSRAGWLPWSARLPCRPPRPAAEATPAPRSPPGGPSRMRRGRGSMRAHRPRSVIPRAGPSTTHPTTPISGMSKTLSVAARRRPENRSRYASQRILSSARLIPCENRRDRCGGSPVSIALQHVARCGSDSMDAEPGADELRVVVDVDALALVVGTMTIPPVRRRDPPVGSRTRCDERRRADARHEVEECCRHAQR